ncbi:MAG: hypothetical protein IJN54_08195 [Lachnospiraceae bacterium]|nr:hypothetical protein [Lachnospiraceae bacterium]
MARGQKKSIEEKIAAKEEVISALEIRLKKEREELQEMYEEKRQRELSSLNELMEENGLDIDSVRNLILQSVG